MDGKSLLSQKPDYLVCTCMEVMYSQIVEAIEEGVDTFEKLSDMLGVGTGCSSCVEEVYEILKEVKKILKYRKKTKVKFEITKEKHYPINTCLK